MSVEERAYESSETLVTSVNVDDWRWHSCLLHKWPSM